ncbi:MULTISPECIES: cytochrome C biogenesis protein [Bacillaceae]|uniref:Cytochrome C biogenesis protein n=2 Tax=Bacillaceae TaxID=186817 RepID=A0A7V7UU72_9BACI|nr:MULTISPECIES: cytochrome C biogenesis protein [Bacillaceae]KAB2331354.1 cytochrome C biogenesis protein [Bacillus mesophilum]QVY62549.1 cytochrome C biogenesis protein [Cytobacillus gottheilii]
MEFQYVKVEVLLPEEYIEKVRNELNNIGVLKVGAYDNVVSYSFVKGYWRPLEEANPFNGTKGEVSSGTECKMEFRCLFERIKEAEMLIRSIHPYEEPIINIIPILT